MAKRNPVIIQGGMGAAVSAWPLARAVAETGHLGVVSGTALDVVLARRLQLGDPGGHLRDALHDFPFPEMAEGVARRYFVAGGKAADAPFRAAPLPSHRPTQEQLELLVVANFVEVHLAKAGHQGAVGINYLEKIQPPLLPSLFGAMLAGVDYVLMGAGIPREIPGYLDRLSQGQSCRMKLDAADGGRGPEFELCFDPKEFTGGQLPWLERPRFLAIVSSATLATMLARKATGHVDGFVIEKPTAGGHNAPPRGALQLNDRGEPIYGARDEPDLQVFRDLGRPFWLAGSYSHPARLQEALALGAAGIQVGTAFAFCDESGLRADLKRQVLERVRQGTVDVVTDPIASPTGFPFKVVQLSGTLSQAEQQAGRARVCDLGYLRHAYPREDGSLGWRCPAEKVAAFVQKGGAASETEGRQCLCNALLANVGLAQVRGDQTEELPLVTSGDDVKNLAPLLPASPALGYSAHDVIRYLMGEAASVPRPAAEVRLSSRPVVCRG